MTTLLIVTGSVGRFCAPVGALTILSATSIPFVTRPKTLYCPSSDGVSATMMKNCDEALSGEFERAIETMPRVCLTVLNSALMYVPLPPVPHVDGDPETVFGSPP